MVSDLTFSCSGRFAILPVPAFAICNLGSVAGALAGEHWGKKVISISQVAMLLDQTPKVNLTVTE